MAGPVGHPLLTAAGTVKRFGQVQARISTQLLEVTRDNLADQQVAKYLYRSQC